MQLSHTASRSTDLQLHSSSQGSFSSDLACEHCARYHQMVCLVCGNMLNMLAFEELRVGLGLYSVVVASVWMLWGLHYNQNINCINYFVGQIKAILIYCSRGIVIPRRQLYGYKTWCRFHWKRLWLQPTHQLMSIWRWRLAEKEGAFQVAGATCMELRPYRNTTSFHRISLQA